MANPQGSLLKKPLSYLSFRRQSVDSIDQEDSLKQFAAIISPSELDTLVFTEEVEEEKTKEQLNFTLRRYLVAEGWNLEKAAKRLAKHVAWRVQEQPSRIKEEEVACHIEAGKSLLQPPGAKGRPLLISVARKHFPDGNIQLLERFVVFCLEAASRYCWRENNPDHKMWILCDLSGLALKNLDAAALRSCFALLNGHYPERAAGVIMYKAPSIFSGVWRVVSPFIDPVSRDKIRWVADDAKAIELLDQVVGLDVVPQEYGGRATRVPVEEAVRMLRQERDAACSAAAKEAPVPAMAREGAADAVALPVPLPAVAVASPRTCRQCAGECMCSCSERALRVGA